MATQITLTVPDEVIIQATDEASATQRSVEAVLTDLLVEAYSPFYVHPRQAEMAEEVVAFEAQHPQLLATYHGQYIAMMGGQVIDHDLNEESLLERVRQHHPERVILIREVLPHLPNTLYVRSPRFV